MQKSKVITKDNEPVGTQVAPKQTPAEKEAIKKSEGKDEPAGAPAPMKILEKGTPAEEGAPVRPDSNANAEADLNRQNSEEGITDPATNRRDNKTVGGRQ